MKRPFTFVTVALTTLVAAACENATAPRDAASLGDGLTAAVQTLDGSFSTTAVLSNDLVGEGSAITYAADFGSEFSAISQVDYLFSFGNDPLDFGECLFFTGQFTGEFAVCNGGTTPQLARLLTFPCSLFPDVCDGFRDGVSSGQLIANRFDGSGGRRKRARSPSP